MSDEPTIGPHLPPYHVVPGEGPEGYLHRTADPDPLIASLTAENEQLFHDNIDYQEEVSTLRRLLGRLRFLIGPVDDDALIGFMERAIDRANVLEDENKRLRAVADAAQRELDAYNALPLIPSGEPHEAWVAALLELHDAVLELFDGTETT